MNRVAWTCLWLVAVGLGSAEAGTWTASSHEALPGETITVDIHFVADGTTIASEIEWQFDVNWLELEAAAGVLPDAARSGQCGYSGGTRIWSVLMDARAAPGTPLLVCQIQFKVRDSAILPRRTRILGIAPICVLADGSSGPCEAESGWVRVLGGTPRPPRFTFEPDPPVAGEPFLLTLYSDHGCEPILLDLPLRTISVEAGRIDVFVRADGVGGPCTGVPPSRHVFFPIPMDGVPAGEYEFAVHAVSVENGRTQLMGRALRTVVARSATALAPPQIIPAVGTIGLGMLVLALPLLAVWNARRGG